MICELAADAEVLVEQDGKLGIQVAMTMDTAAAVLAAVEPRLREADVVLDLAAVPAVDSAVLSVVLSLLRVARASGHRLSLVNVPTAFCSLATLYGVDAILSEHLPATSPDAHV
ncbi:STAS domain-containing protein [Uliginosibacterium sp. H3]|uniref:STAS domain-containing protein n=1 Tax=Uliginosibacterium silvisoli TaxID=3114758 RepID=A0ABU6K5J7_9RHOO|nr:STAS domain-containing protein [Uliginosibacterium sp. H3]